MAQSEHVLLTHFDLITWARRQGGSGGKCCIIAETMSRYLHRVTLQYFTGEKKKITILCSYMIKKKKKCWLTPNWVMSGKQICLGSMSSTGKEFILPSEHMQNKTF